MSNKFVKGTLTLIATSLLLKSLGFFYQIFMVRVVGTETLGIINMVYPFYMALVIFATMSMPLAISRMVAREIVKDNSQNIKRIMHLAFLVVAILVVIAIFLAIFIMPIIFNKTHMDTRLKWCFYMFIPGILIVPFTSVLRGYFQGKSQMLEPSIGQMVEQIVRIACGVAVVFALQGKDVLYVAMALSLAMMFGEFMGFISLFVLYKKDKLGININSVRKNIFSEMLSLSVPATLTKLTSSLDMMIEAWLLPYCFWLNGNSRSVSAKMYGDLSAVAFNFLSIPTILTSALATMLIPTVAQSSLSGDKYSLGRSCAKALALTYMFSCPVVVVIYLYGEDLIYLIFAIKGLGEVVQDLCFGAMFIYLGQTTVGILQGLGENKIVFINNFCGSFLKTVGIYYFVYVLKMGLDGAAWGFVIGYGGQCVLNIGYLLTKVRLRLLYREILLPPILSAIFIVSLPKALAYLQFLPYSLALIVAISLNCAIYLLILIVSKTFSLKLFD